MFRREQIARLVLAAVAGGLVGLLAPGPAWLAPVLAAIVAAIVGGMQASGDARRVALARRWLSRLRRGKPASPPLPRGAPDALDDLLGSFAQFSDRQDDKVRRFRFERDRLEAILAAMEEAVVVLDPAGRVLRANAQVGELLGLADSLEPVGLLLQDLCREPALLALLSDALAAGTSAAGEIEVQSDESRRLGVAIRPTADRSAWVLVLRDLTAQRRLEQMRTDFVANVSHELQTPLTAIKGFAETLLEGALEDPQALRRYLGIIDRHAERVGRLISDLLVLSDLELGRIPVDASPVRLGAVLEDVTDLLGDAAEQRGVVLQRASGPDLMVLGDADRLVQVFTNLVDNGIKYTPAGGSVEISVRAPAEEGDPVAVVVADSGVGIPEADLPRLAERFYRVDKARSREAGGTGLGLSIVRHIVLAHGGELSFESRVGAGTTVSVSLPQPATEVVRGRETSPR